MFIYNKCVGVLITTVTVPTILVAATKKSKSLIQYKHSEGDLDCPVCGHSQQLDTYYKKENVVMRAGYYYM
jgi:hypothetical protein